MTAPTLVRGRAGRGRPKSDGNRLKRLRAFELYAGGQRKAEIARTLGVTKASVGTWAKNDTWDSRLSAIAARAEDAVDLTTGTVIADIITRIRAKYNQRLNELDAICTSVLSTPQTKISAIKAWFELGQKVQPDALKPSTDPRNLELIQDLLETPDLVKGPRPVQDLLEPQPSPPVGASDSTGQG